MSDFFSQVIVTNTGPLLALSRVGQISLLGRMFPGVIVPREVMEELLVTPYSDVDELRRELLQFSISTTYSTPEPMLVAQLDAGEAAVIATAVVQGAKPVLMDERKGRRVATVVYKLPVIGTGGLLVAAKQRGLIPAVRPLLDEMRAGGYYLGPILVGECLRRAGE